MILKKFVGVSFVIVLFYDAFAQRAQLDPESLSDFRYSVNFIEEDGESFLSLISNLIGESERQNTFDDLRITSLQKKPVLSIRILKDRIKSDVRSLYRNARKLGFYGATISPQIEIINSKKVNVNMRIKFKKIYSLRTDTEYINQDNNFSQKYLSLAKKHAAKLKASIVDIKNLQKLIIEDLQKDGYFEPKITDKLLEIDDDLKICTLVLKIDPGKRVKFGSTKIEGSKNVKKEFIRNRIDWFEGDYFDITRIESTAENLRDTQLFSAIDITPDKERFSNDKLPIKIILSEDKKYMIDFSLLYSGVKSMNFDKNSSVKKGLKSLVARVGWTNYNTFGGGEKLSFIFEGTPVKARDKRVDFSFETRLTQNDVFLKNNEVEYTFCRLQELTNVFFKKSDKIQVTCHYPIFEDLYGILGGNIISDYVNSDEIFFKNSERSEKYRNLNIPIGIYLNKTDSVLNPTSGYTFGVDFEYVFLRHTNIRHLKTLKIESKFHKPLGTKNVFSTDLKWRQLLIHEIDDVPLDRRIFAGGINSVRGYANQMAGELIKTNGVNLPFGARASIEFNTEFRHKFTNTLEGAVFFDGAKMLKNKPQRRILSFEKNRYFLSTGVGFRYHTSIGPIRVDFAFPMKKRKDIDSKMQFIMSLGQAF